jgi:hypothetical protein
MQHKEGRFKSVCIAHYNLFVKPGFIIRMKINANSRLCSGGTFGCVRPSKHNL